MRLTEKTKHGCVLKEGVTPEQATEKLLKYEEMRERLETEYEKTVQEMENLKAEGRVKTVTYRQLFAAKLKLMDLRARFDIAESFASTHRIT